MKCGAPILYANLDASGKLGQVQDAMVTSWTGLPLPTEASRHVETATTSKLKTNAVADPGFPVGGGGADLVGGVPTPEAATFRKICMSKQKNLDPWGGARRRCPPDPPMQRDRTTSIVLL